MDPEEPEQLDEDEIMDVIASGPVPTADIVQIAAVWVVEMAAQPDGFVIEEEELVEAIVEAQAFAAAVEIAKDDLDDDEDIGDADDLMDDN